MIRIFVIFGALLGLTACMGPPLSAPSAYYPQYQPRPGQGQYVRPEWLAPSPTPMIPAVDACRSRLYAGLVGQHEGAIHIPGLPGRKRILKPAFDEGFGYSPEEGFYEDPNLMMVRDYLPDQALYAPSISTVTDRIQLGPEIGDRLTIELDQEGYVQEIRCG